MSNNRVWGALVLGAALMAAEAAAQPVVVEAVQYPAWLERGGNSVPLTPGMALQARDQVRTGGEARVRLRMSEGSRVKLGENARFSVERIEDRGILRGGLTVLAGAFRFTTDKDVQGKSRDLSIRAKNVTAGIRGTDLWGKSTEERDWVVLIEGRISVAAEGHPAVTLEKPLDYYQKPRDAAPSVATIDRAQLDAWARETEMEGEGASAAPGGWRVILARFRDREEARTLRRAARAAGFPAEIVGGPQSTHVVHVPGFAGEAEARAAMARLRGVKGTAILSVTDSPPGR